MKRKFKIAMLLAIVSLATAYIFSGCKKSKTEEFGTVTISINKTTSSFAIANINIPHYSGPQILELGFKLGSSENIKCIDPLTDPLIIMDTKSSVIISNYKSISIPIINLEPNSTYSVKAYYANSRGIFYSADVSFKTISSLPKIKDVDGNEYDTTTIGTQVWTVQDLMVTHYRDGSPIPNVTDNTAWTKLNSGAMCYYNNDPKYKGVLYNDFAATDPRGLAPVGWHVATLDDWLTLKIFLCGGIVPSGIDGGKMKEAGTAHWLAPNTGADNSTVFTAIPTGDRSSDNGLFYDMGIEAVWLSVDKWPMRACLFYNSASFQAQYVFSSNTGSCVRCVKDK